MKICVMLAALILGASILGSVYLYTERTRYFFMQGHPIVGDRITGKMFVRYAERTNQTMSAEKFLDAKE